MLTGKNAPKVDSAYEAIVDPELFSTSVTIDDDDKPPIEPNIGEVSFLKLPIVNDIKGRVDRLMQGVNNDIPPEYDHYGYEIRRYMARIGNLKIFTDEAYVVEQIKNVRKAGVIADYWQKSLEKEIEEIEAIIEEETEATPVPFAVRSAFKQNKITIGTFLISLKTWIGSNERVLRHIYDNPGAFDLLYPEVICLDANVNREYYNHMLIKQTKLKEIVVYDAFLMMVY